MKNTKTYSPALAVERSGEAERSEAERFFLSACACAYCTCNAADGVRAWQLAVPQPRRHGVLTRVSVPCPWAAGSPAIVLVRCRQRHASGGGPVRRACEPSRQP